MQHVVIKITIKFTNHNFIEERKRVEEEAQKTLKKKKKKKDKVLILGLC